MIPKLSFTEFIDVVIRTGMQKVTKIRQIKNKPEYEPAFDFYRSLRMYLIEIHQKQLYNQKRKTAIDLTDDKKKFGHYDALLNGYWKFLGKKKPGWFTPVSIKVPIQAIEIVINPELGLIINDNKYLIKLYLKDEDLSKQKVEVALGMMEHYIKPLIKDNIKMAILDVRNSKIYERNAEKKDIDVVVQAECAYISSIWNQL